MRDPVDKRGRNLGRWMTRIVDPTRRKEEVSCRGGGSLTEPGGALEMEAEAFTIRQCTEKKSPCETSQKSSM